MANYRSLFKPALVIVVIILFFLILILAGEIVFNKTYKFPAKVSFGVTFSQKYASQLSGDWRDVYMKILDDLKVKRLRIPSYWDEMEKSPSQFNFEDLDFILSEAEKREVKVILVLGVRQPRWPECHIPDWATKLSIKDRQENTLQFISKVVDRYKDSPAVWAWQVENEPLFKDFGQGCDQPKETFLRSEIELVRKMSQKPILMTDSGELGFWITSMQLSDIFGTTLYRQIYDSVLGYTTYPLLPYFYNLKSSLVRNVFAKNNQKTIISELQAEPWSPTNDLKDTPLAVQTARFSVDNFREYVNYARQTGFDTAYLWGVEWWYFMEKQGYPQYVEFAKTLYTKP